MVQVVVGLRRLVGILFAVVAEAVGSSLHRIGGRNPPSTIGGNWCSSGRRSHQGLLREGAVPVAVARDGGRARVAPHSDEEVRPGENLLVVRRRQA